MAIPVIVEITVKAKNYVEFIYCECKCGKTRPLKDNNYKKYKFIRGHQRRNISLSKEIKEKIGNNRKGKCIGEKHWNYKGGKIKQNGYSMIFKPEHPFADHHDYIREHRLIYEEHHKCCLLSYAVIHHIDGDKLNNNINNLLAFSNHSNHMKHHNSSSTH